MGFMPGADLSVLATDINSQFTLQRCDGVIIHTIGGGPGPAAAATWSTDRYGHIWQHRDDDRWTSANLDGNPYYLAVENGDRGPGWPAWPLNDPSKIPPLTDAQVEANARIIVHVHKTKGIPIQRMPDSLPGRRGVGVHRLGIDGNFQGYAYPGRVRGGVRYSSVYGKVCPTDVRIRQVYEEVIPLALSMVNGDAMLPDTFPTDWNALIWRVQSILRMESSVTGGPTKGEVNNLVVDLQYLAHRVAALSTGSTTIAGGPEMGTEMWTVATLKRVEAATNAITNQLGGVAADVSALTDDEAKLTAIIMGRESASPEDLLAMLKASLPEAMFQALIRLARNEEGGSS